MIKRKSFNFIIYVLLFAFYTLICTTCENPIMQTWWPEDFGGGRSGVNFAVVYFDLNGGLTQDNLSEMKPFRVLYNAKIPRIRSIHHTNTTLGFGGWLDENNNIWDLDTRSVKQGDDVDGDGIITLTAKWSQSYVTVKFFPHYDHIPASLKTVTVPDQKIVPGNKIVEPPVLPNDGVHGLVGWYTTGGNGSNLITNLSEYNAILSHKWDFENKIVEGPVNGTIELYARWSTYSRTVHLHVNGGTRPNGQELTRVNFTVFAGLAGASGGKIIDPGPLVREGYTFEGWYTEEGRLWDFATSRIDEVDDWVLVDDYGEELDGERLRNDVFILNARWVPNIYNVTFDPAGGVPAPSKQEVKHGERATMPPPMTNADASKAFVGWFTDAGTEWNFASNSVTRSMTLTARWETMTYTVTFHLGYPPEKRNSENKIICNEGLHKVYLDAQPAVQRVKTGGKVIEPFMPALPADVAANNWSFVQWDYRDTGDDPTQVNVESWRNGLSEWKFETNTVTTKNINLYARWVEPAPDMIWVPPGSFVMGDSGVSGSPADYHAYPTRRVTLDGFYISRYEVTQINSPDSSRGYGSIMGINPSQFWLNDFRPVERVSWFDAVLYCNRLTSLEMPGEEVYTTLNVTSRASSYLAGTQNRETAELAAGLTAVAGYINNGVYPITNATVTANWTKRGYRLPTEAEWEYAARGGNNSPGNFTYSGSNDATQVAWYNTTVAQMTSGSTQIAGHSSKRPNALGIYDMSGNISEWVWDWFTPYKNITATDNPTGPTSSPDGTRVRRGGQWNNAASNVRSAVRMSATPDTANWVIGFRVVRGPSAIW